MQRILTFSILVIISIALLTFGIFGIVKTSKDANNLGGSYLALAQSSADVNTSIIMLKKYANALEENEMTTGSVGVYYKIPKYDMENRYQRLLIGIDFLEQLAEKYNKGERLNTVDLEGLAILTNATDSDGNISLSKYIGNLDVGIWTYMTANSMYYRFLGFWGIFALVLGGIGFVMWSIFLACAIYDEI